MGKIISKETGIKAQYNFDSLVTGEANQFAVKACLEAARSPGDTYNPLFISGPAGVGKTHMMQSIAHTMLIGNPDCKIRYISCERFSNEVIQAIAEDNMRIIRDRYSKLDLWILDDIQFLLESKTAQIEFLHIFNNLHAENSQIVLGADRPLKKLSKLDKNILSRLDCGLSVEVQLPDIKMRVEALYLKQSKFELDLSEQIIHYVAGMLRSSIRELEGFFKKISAYQTLSHQEINIELVERVVREFLPDGSEDIKPEPVPASVKKDPKKESAPAKEKPAPEKSSHREDPTPKASPDSSDSSTSISMKTSSMSSPTPIPADDPHIMQPAASNEEMKIIKKIQKTLEVLMPHPPSPPPIVEEIQDEAEEEKVQEKEAEEEKVQEKIEEMFNEKEAAPADKEIPIVEDEINADEVPSGHKEVGAVFFYPAGAEAALNAVSSKFQEVIKKHKLKFYLKRVHNQDYNCSSKIDFSLFVKACKTNKVPVAIVIGPPPNSKVQEQDFYDLLSVTLEVEGISLQLVNFSEIDKDYRYLNLALDIALVRTK